MGDGPVLMIPSQICGRRRKDVKNGWMGDVTHFLFPQWLDVLDKPFSFLKPLQSILKPFQEIRPDRWKSVGWVALLVAKANLAVDPEVGATSFYSDLVKRKHRTWPLPQKLARASPVMIWPCARNLNNKLWVLSKLMKTHWQRERAATLGSDLFTLGSKPTMIKARLIGHLWSCEW